MSVIDYSHWIYVLTEEKAALSCKLQSGGYLIQNLKVK